MKNNLKRIYSKNKPLVFATIYGLVRLAYKPYFFNQRTIFFSHNKSANSTLSMAYESEHGNIYVAYFFFDAGIWVRSPRLLPPIQSTVLAGACGWS